ncbi:MAG: Fic family protein [Wenzhouxiangella sp.]|nr:MAG: Fic family protein [Wenzhouxiangella sp.]
MVSKLGTRLRETWSGDGSVQREYPTHYQPADSLAGHLEFALKHEGVNLAVLGDLFRASGPGLVEAAVAAKPTGRYRRQMGFFYELLTGEQLDQSLKVGGNYAPALDPARYLVAPNPTLDRRWRIRDNLLGNGLFCPVIRRTERLDLALAAPLGEELATLLADYPPEMFQRVNDYLYLKETRSTFDIEHEPMPESSRLQRFVALLREAGRGPEADLLDEEKLTERQNLIVDSRYAVTGYRESQNYVGEQRPDFSQRIHYICPAPEWVPGMMDGLSVSLERSAGLPVLGRAAVVSFGFVFIHPFEDGNGRLHRFLIHDLLQRGRLVERDLVLPVSATMLRRMVDYDAALERFSRPLMSGWVDYDLGNDGHMTMRNSEQVENYYRYPDLTAQAEYLAETVAATVREDVVEELGFLRAYDRARAAVREVVDMPDRRLDLLLRLLHSNGGRLSKNKRGRFEELTSREITQIESGFRSAFALDRD